MWKSVLSNLDECVVCVLHRVHAHPSGVGAPGRLVYIAGAAGSVWHVFFVCCGNFAFNVYDVYKFVRVY